MKITNTSKASQGVHTTDGHRYIRAGETVDFELTEGGLKLASRLPFLDMGEAEPEAAEPAPKTRGRKAVVEAAPEAEPEAAEA